MPLPRLASPLFLLLLLPACTSVYHARGLKIASDPPGARILVDGRESGYVTPAMIDLGGGSTRVDLLMPGYETATRVIGSGGFTWVLHWNEMTLEPGTWRFPLWIPLEDVIPPVNIDSGPEPGRVFVRLRLAADR